jgi:pimeloyl-ACP methyl ester carboxylesterase
VTPLLAVRSGNGELAVHAQGTGVPVVFLHAGVADRRMWDAQVATIGRDGGGYRAIAYDRRGFGNSLPVEEAWSHVDDLMRVLDAVAGREPAVLVGSSQGGRIALDAALAEPARVRALVLVAPAISGAPEATEVPPAIQAWIDAVERAEAAADIDRINELEAHAWLDGPLEPEGRVGGDVRELFLEMNGIALRAEERGSEIEPPSAYARLHDVAVPALIMWGDLDFPRIAQRCEILVARLPHARPHKMTGVAHLPNLERPDEFNRVLLDFLARGG